MLANRYIDLAKTPITTTEFCGEDVRYSAEFEVLELELAKADSLHEAAGPDWALIREGSENLLKQHSKDLRAAVWLTWSLFQSDSYGGLQAGVSALLYLCKHHWQTLHPRKPRTRLAAFGWLMPRLERAVENSADTQENIEPATISAFASQLRELNQCLLAHMASEAPDLLPLCRRLDELATRDAKPKPASAPNAQKTTTATVTPIHTQASNVNISPIDVSNTREANKVLRTLQNQARPLCDWWLSQSATDPRAIRLSRTLLWLQIDALPEHDLHQQTPLRGLPSDRLAAYAERLGQSLNHGQRSELLRELETSVGKSPFWLDGQRLVWECLEALGAKSAQRELEAQVSSLLLRLPGLEQLRFHDGSPFADDRTQAWLAASSSTMADSPSSSATSAPGNQQAPWEEALNLACDLMRKENLKAAVALLKQGMQTASNERERFQWQFSQARLCHIGKHFELAAYQLEALHQNLHDARLDRWEPELAVSILQLLADSYQRLPRTQAATERRQDIYQRLCRLDLEAALDQTHGS
ncbi:type VI secretion system protein TssA [uncultured Halopseudomonas sp.]|uniref:type VI secretion system protein TssA n=1 Tax=uncultured Halopseudomonas sp. TaxID=2901193 RepID=UPI0030EC05BD|tara:strand:- start:21437 stop:23026 length:1590 start_codon:yes stop_codon:yes gene_type:complete